MVLEIRGVVILGGDVRRHEGSIWYANNLSVGDNMFSLCSSIK